ncbi:MAG: phosphatidate cytidylyltransferase [Anaerolineae bacterium]
MLRTRVIVALVLIPLVIGLLYVGGIPWLLGVLFTGVLAWREMALLLLRQSSSVDRTLGLFFIVGAVVEAYLHSISPSRYDLLRPLLVALIIFSLIWTLYNKGEHPTADWGITVASALYLGITLSYLVALRQRPDGFAWALTAFLVTWSCDTMAYFVGSSLGRHKLWPRISPKKTWEGLVGGTAAALAAGVIVGIWLLALPWWQGLGLGALVAVAAPFGDFAESLFKRLANVKDSSQLIPGHGGALDRVDSLLFVFPVVTYFALVVGGF